MFLRGWGQWVLRKSKGPVHILENYSKFFDLPRMTGYLAFQEAKRTVTRTVRPYNFCIGSRSHICFLKFSDEVWQRIWWKMRSCKLVPSSGAEEMIRIFQVTQSSGMRSVWGTSSKKEDDMDVGHKSCLYDHWIGQNRTGLGLTGLEWTGLERYGRMKDEQR